MTPDECTDAEDDFAAMLAACDEAAADGALPPIVCDDVLTADQERLLKDLECVRLLRDRWPRRAQPTPAGRPATAQRQPLSQIGRFRIDREIGRGGFGVVYLAFDPVLSRPVAVKVPREDVLANPRLCERFHGEARAAAALDHPNVVSVYETGTVGGVSYIASAYCPGETLAEWLGADRHAVPFREAAELVARIADGIEHAHRRGILHRDLKPANVILQTSGDEVNVSAAAPTLAALNPKVTDFGLAKRLFADGGDQKTADGSVLGTPNYLAPEQAEPSFGAVGPPVDVYGLGAILYELLTCRPPFTSDSVLETLRQVRTDDPVPPRLLRSQVPRDLETICLKCLEKSPKHRYPSAAALADDLRRFAGGKPVLARPVGVVGRAWRWAKRRPAAAGLTTLLVLTLLGGVLGILIQWQRAEHFAERMTEERNAAVLERARAEASFKKAREVVDRLSRVGHNLANRPGLDGTRREVFEQVLTFYEGFVDEDRTDYSFRLEAARANIQVAVLRRALGRYDLAEQAFQKAERQLAALLVERPADREARYSMADCAHVHGHLLRGVNREPEAAASYRRAAGLFEQLAAENPKGEHYRVTLASSLLNAAAADLAVGRVDRIDQDLARAERLQRDLLAANPQSSWFRQELALCLEVRAFRHIKSGRLADGEAELFRAHELFRAVVADYPTNTDFRGFFARSLRYVGNILRRNGKPEQAKSYLREGVEVSKRLVADTPGVLVNQIAHGDLLVELADLLTQLGQTNEGLQLRKEAVKLLRSVTKANPKYGLAYNKLAWLIATHPNEPLGSVSEALQCSDKAVANEPWNDAFWNTLAMARFRSGDDRGAVAALERAAALANQPSPEDGLVHALVLKRLGKGDQAREHLDRALAKCDRQTVLTSGLRRLRAEAVLTVTGQPHR